VERPARFLQCDPNEMDDRLTLEPRPPSLAESIGRALDLAQSLAIDELRLLQVESQERLQEIARRGVWIAAGIFCLVLAWVGLLSALVVALEERLPLETRLGVVAGSQLVLGVVLLVSGLRRRRP
jgi:hypothetical protein